MNLKNPELFQAWLIRQLKPICKANPEPVSKYVYALLKKKEKNDGDLKESLISQLKVFLENATEEFVNFLIDVLENDKYLIDDADFQRIETISTDKVDSKLDISVELELDAGDKEKEQRKSPSPIQAPTPSPPRRPQFQKSFSPRQSRRSRFRNERRRIINRKSRRDNSSHSDSPTADRRTVARKRSASGSSESSTKSPRRSWIASRPSDTKKYKHRNFARSPQGQRSRSNSPKLRKRKPTNGSFRKRGRPISRSNSDDERYAHTKRPQNYQNDVNRDVHAEIPTVTTETTFNQKQRCVDFEGKGYCARGDMCPFDHGPAPIVLDNSLLNGIVPIPPPIHNNNFQETNLYTPQFVNPSFPAKHFRGENSAPVTTRELIPVPTVPLPQKFENKPKNVHGGKPSFGHIFSSLPPGVSQTTIELSNVPTDLNNIPSLYEHFSNFGNITLIQAKRNGDANTALLTFTNATEAALAFINVDSAIPKTKAAWYADKCILKPFPRKSIPASGQANTKSFVLKRNATNSNEKNKPPTPVKETPSETSVEKKPQEYVMSPSRLLTDLIKKKKELLEKQLAYKKEIEDKMKSLEKGSKDFKTWSEMLKKLNDVITENQNSLQSSILQQKEYLQKIQIIPMDSATINNMKHEQRLKAAVATNNKEKENASKNQNQEACEESVFEIDVDSSILNQELEEDEDETQANSSQTENSKTESEVKSGPTDYTRVVVSGFENGDEEDLILHFSQFGNILDKEIDKTIPQATLIYDNRKSAEEAKKLGRNFQDRLLSVTVFGGKKYQPLMRRVASFKPQYEKDYQYPAYGGGNPYKYKNPQIHSQATVSRPPNRNIYTYRADQKRQASKPQESDVKLTEEEDLVTFLQKGGLSAKEVEKYMD